MKEFALLAVTIFLSANARKGYVLITHYLFNARCVSFHDQYTLFVTSGALSLCKLEVAG